MPWGRGGAGNIAQAEEAKKRMEEDIEAAHTCQTTNPSAPAEPAQNPFIASAIPSSSSTSSATQPYAHSGRGGAGNWFSPSHLASTGTFTSTSTTASTPQLHTKAAAQTKNLPTSALLPYDSVPLAKAGRGGAGNMVWAEDAAGAGGKKEVEDEKERDVKRSVEKDVEAGLAKPGKAFLGAEERVGVTEGVDGWVG